MSAVLKSEVLLLNMSYATYWNYKGFLPAWENLQSFSVPGATGKVDRLCLLGVISAQADTISYWWDQTRNYQLRAVMGTRVKFTVDI